MNTTLIGHEESAFLRFLHYFDMAKLVAKTYQKIHREKSKVEISFVMIGGSGDFHKTFTGLYQYGEAVPKQLTIEFPAKLLFYERKILSEKVEEFFDYNESTLFQSFKT